MRESLTKARKTGRRYSVLVCKGQDDHLEGNHPGITLVESPVACLDRATTGLFDHIVVVFNAEAGVGKEIFLELCRVLRRNSHSCGIPVTALLPSIHRQLLQELAESGVEYAFPGSSDNNLSLPILEDMLEKEDPENYIDRMLDRICPFVNYKSLDQTRDMRVCGACNDCMVLGPQLLKNLCHMKGYSECRYFLRKKSGKK